MTVVQKRVDDQRAAQRIQMSFWDSAKGQEIVKTRGQPEEAKIEATKTKELEPSDPKLAKRSTKFEKFAAKMKPKETDVRVKEKSKKKRSWEDEKPALASLNKSEAPEGVFTQATSRIDFEKLTFEDDHSDDDPSEENINEAEDTKNLTSKKIVGGGVFGFIKSLTQKDLSAETLAPVIDQIRTHLIAKNVAANIADELCESVQNSLIGKTHGTFKSIANTVKAALAEVLTRLLTPKKVIDVPRQIAEARAQNRPYTMVFVGVNGVGKSTSLAKVAAWLLKQKYTVMIAACDTFRSGAVEQLKVHARALGDIPLFDQGYGKDAANIAHQAINRAKRENIDVVLIDTAGRMQDNNPLMVALANLIKVNRPDLILFVGEALVGNDSVDQLTKFNRALEENGDPANPRTIDGILLTKFDTVDAKVGASISMVYTTGVPIVFVGVGQTYNDLRTLNTKKIVDVLAAGRPL